MCSFVRETWPRTTEGSLVLVLQEPDHLRNFPPWDGELKVLDTEEGALFWWGSRTLVAAGRSFRELAVGAAETQRRDHVQLDILLQT
ncbi:hypothetical protein NDU88_000566 [Pleurodeles waltl]|uniref:Uncharacterized protein n=1 Tax=Pleurodeles waltl TaxID=8319 RepID=A0AAV7N8D6_PLEWA|nr:hypothetical protein NDU88_000566 [Pleurodeles waltl]